VGSNKNRKSIIMSKTTTIIVKCDKCKEVMPPEDGGGCLSAGQDLNEEDGGYIDFQYSDLCKKCARSLIKTLVEWDKSK
jgi:hypothetical protein